MFFGYVRVSTEEQAASDRTSLKEQERVIRGVAMTRGLDKFDVVVYADPGVSGSIALKERPGGAKLFAQVQKGDVVCASKLDRMFRSCSDALNTAEEWKKQGIELILFDMGCDPVTSNGAAKFFFTILAAAADFERGRINDRTADGRRGKKERGGHLGGQPPYGFKVVGEGREAKLEPNEQEREIIRTAVALRRKFPLGRTTRELRALGMRDRAGSEFRVVQVKRLLQAGVV
jgi:putative DNA-invertase from lambdoid prophage Rac